MKLSTSVSIVAILAFTCLIVNQLSNGFDLAKVDSELLAEFQMWKKQFNRDYDNSNEEVYRLNIFIQNLQKIKNHNLQKEKSYEVGINQFSDLTEFEFQARHLTLIPQVPSLKVESESLNSVPSQVSKTQDEESYTAGPEINWVEKGFVTSVKDQGQCGACWAFAAIGPMQAMIKQQGKPLVSLSAQQLMDCSNSYGNYGCNGGYMENGFKYIRDKGITTQEKYPYKGVNQKCNIDGGEYKVKSYVAITDCKTLASALLSIPIAVGVDATKFYSYKSGVFNSCSDKPILNHAFALVGMTDEYWLAKEQWGVKWGQNGYIKISRAGSSCGVCDMASYPL